MTKEEALKAKKQLKENSSPPAMSTRSKDRVLRKQYIILCVCDISVLF